MRNLLFLAASAALLLACLTPATAQTVLNQDGSITITSDMQAPTLAPPLPAAAADEAAKGSADEPTGVDRISLRDRHQLGFTRIAAIRAATRLARSGKLPSTQGLTGEDLEAAKAEIKEAIALEMVGDNVQAWGDTVGERDWSVFFQALLDFLEQFMPFLLQILNIFSNMSSNAILTPTTNMADCVLVVGPPVMILAA